MPVRTRFPVTRIAPRSSNLDASRILQTRHSFKLLRAYAMASFYKEPAALQSVCASQTHVAGHNGSGNGHDGAAADPHATSLPPQYARRLAQEIAQREEVEQALRESLKDQFFPDAVEAAGLKGASSFHGLRHLFAVRLLTRGVPITIVSESARPLRHQPHRQALRPILLRCEGQVGGDEGARSRSERHVGSSQDGAVARGAARGPGAAQPRACCSTLSRWIARPTCARGDRRPVQLVMLGMQEVPPDTDRGRSMQKVVPSVSDDATLTVPP